MSQQGKNGESFKNKLLKYLYPATDFGGGAWKAYFSTYITMLYTDIYLIPVVLAGMLELVSSFMGWFSGPIWGTFLDRVTLKKGKYWQWVMIGATGEALIYITIFALPSLTSNPSSLAYLIFILAASLSLASAVNNTTLIALYPRLGQSAEDRSFLAIGRSIGRTSSKTVFGYLTPILLLFFTSRGGSDANGWAMTGYVLGIAGLLFYLAFALFLRTSDVEKQAIAERNVPKQARKKVPLTAVIKGVVTNGPLLVMFLFFFLHKLYDLGFQTLTASFFFKYYVGDMAALGTFFTFRTMSQAIGVALGIAWLKIFKDSKRAFVAAGILHVIVLVISVFVVGKVSTIVFILTMSASQIFVGLMEAYTLPFFAAASDYATLKTGVRTDGLNMSVYGLALRVSTTVATVVRVSILAAVGYNAALYVDGVGPSQAVLNQFAYFQTLYPLILAAVAVALVAFFYPITDKKLQEIKDELNRREQADNLVKA
ncbi:MAG: hypothetical protein GX922_05845 [Firmicutes bacterium]|nr:hypothetical protein [Bacillota bacterium]